MRSVYCAALEFLPRTREAKETDLMSLVSYSKADRNGTGFLPSGRMQIREEVGKNLDSV